MSTGEEDLPPPPPQFADLPPPVFLDIPMPQIDLNDIPPPSPSNLPPPPEFNVDSLPPPPFLPPIEVNLDGNDTQNSTPSAQVEQQVQLISEEKSMEKVPSLTKEEISAVVSQLASNDSAVSSGLSLNKEEAEKVKQALPTPPVKSSSPPQQTTQQSQKNSPNSEEDKSLSRSGSGDSQGRTLAKSGSSSSNFAALRATFAAVPPVLEQKPQSVRHSIHQSNSTPAYGSNAHNNNGDKPSNAVPALLNNAAPKKVSNIAANLEKMGGIPIMGMSPMGLPPRGGMKESQSAEGSFSPRPPSQTISRMPDAKKEAQKEIPKDIRSRSGTETSTNSNISKGRELRSSGGSTSSNDDSGMDSSLLGMVPSPSGSFLSPITSPRLKDLTDSDKILAKQANRIGFRKQVTLRKLASDADEQIDKNIGEAVGALVRDFKSAIGDDQFSDFMLLIKDQKVPAHKIILASRSPFFRRLFQKKGVTEHMLKCDSFEEGAAVVEYIYTGQLPSIPIARFESLYLLAGELELPELQSLCTEASATVAQPEVKAEEKTPENQAEKEVNQKRRERRKFIATETLETERTYVKSLKIIFDTMIVPFKQASSEKNPILSADEIAQVFSFWEVILKCHESLFTVLEQRIAVWDELPELGDIFLDKIAFIKLYKHYINNFDKSIISTKELQQKRPKFKEFLAKHEFSPAMNGLSLQSFLILPVQRIPRYVLLLADLLKNTEKTDPDFNNLSAALEMIKELADYINANKHDTDEINRLLAIQDRVSGWPSETEKLVKARRRLMREGQINVNKDKCTVFLFTDALLITKGKGSKLKYKDIIPLQTSSLIQNSEKFDFEIMAPSGKVGFHAGDEKESWTRAIAEAVEKSQKELLNSAFAGHELKDSEGSKQFKENRDEEYRKKCHQIVKDILKSEQEYVELLSIILETFYEPLRSSNPPLLTNDQSRIIFSSAPSLYKAHSEFLKVLAKRVAEWNNESIISDIFYAHTAEVLKPYEIYFSDNSEAMETLDFLGQSDVNWTIWLVKTEKESGHMLVKLVEAPIRRLSNYYLALQELVQYTHENNPDHEKLPQVVIRIQEHLENVKAKKTERSSRPRGLERRGSTRMSPLGTKSSGNLPVPSRKTSMTVSASTSSKPRKAIGDVKF
eukprot:TRINITY_DN2334_c0_g1_i1.p1 TRINITY_DN2334_c0_g1~~TRINITY_DN2334_c0_g1_i1.p1  ORF type:complete len:1143 (-),score=430.50 TRINITY_DN2334_c0_g1_i1:283-3711(-)